MLGIIQEFSRTISAKPHDYFDTDHLKPALKAHSVRSGSVTMISQSAKFLIQTSSTVILARLLTPNDYGLFTMVVAVTGFVALFKDMGLSLAAVQKTDLTHDQASNLFWINAAIGLVLALVSAALAPTVAWFYNEPRLTSVTLSLAVTFLLSGLAVQHQALLTRQMLFATLALIDLVSIGTGTVVGIALGLHGASYWALVGMSIAIPLSNTTLTWMICRWRPGFPVRHAGVSSMVKFGGEITAFEVVNYFARNFDNLLLGRYWGANVLGLYSRAYSMMMLPISQIRGPLAAVATPAMSLIRDNTARYRTYYIRLITLISFSSMPLMAFLFATADRVVFLVLGGQWAGAIPIFRILCINAFVQPVMGTAGLVLISLGQSRRWLVMGSINSLVILTAFVLGLPWGAVGVAVAYSISTYALLVPTLWGCFRRSPISVADFFAAVLRPLVASLIMGLCLLTVQPHFRGIPDIVALAASFVMSAFIYLLTLVLLPGGLRLLRDIAALRSLLSE